MKKIKIILLTCMIMILNIGISYGATNTYEIKMEPSKTEIYAGDTIKIPVKIENIDVEEGIVAYSTLLSYNENILEVPEISTGSNWEKPNVVENLIQSTTKTMQPVKEDQEIMEITFKVKEDAQLGETNIALLNFEVSDGENTIENGNEIDIKINVTSTQKQVTNVVVKSIWFTQRNIVVASIISIVTLFIIVLLTVYYIQHREKEEKNNVLYEEVEGISEEDVKEDTKEETEIEEE